MQQKKKARPKRNFRGHWLDLQNEVYSEFSHIILHAYYVKCRDTVTNFGKYQVDHPPVGPIDAALADICASG